MRALLRSPAPDIELQRLHHPVRVERELGDPRAPRCLRAHQEPPPQRQLFNVGGRQTPSARRGEPTEPRQGALRAAQDLDEAADLPQGGLPGVADFGRQAPTLQGCGHLVREAHCRAGAPGHQGRHDVPAIESQLLPGQERVGLEPREVADPEL